jgi:hypothetical protein
MFIKPDLDIVYPNKAELKRHKKLNLMSYASYAASIAIIIGTFIFFYDKPLDNNNTSTAANTSYMDYPQVSFNIEAPTQIAQNTEEDHTIEKNSVVNSNKTIRKIDYKKLPIQKHNNIEVQEYDYHSRINIDETPVLYSRKGKLAMSTPTDLEKYLLDNFNKNEVNYSSVAEAIKAEQTNSNNAFGNLKEFNAVIQIASSFTPEVNRKKILGSQPVPEK